MQLDNIKLFPVGTGKSKNATLIQELLNLSKAPSVKCDGDYGPATMASVKIFQKTNKLGETGIVDEATFAALLAPLTRATTFIPKSKDLLSAIVEVSKAHLKEHPLEINGQNSGPWVRYYMDGNQGNAWPWCAGSATAIIKQAAAALNVAMPCPRTYSCDVIGMDAKKRGILVSGKTKDIHKIIKPGHLFLVIKATNDWQHVGIVTEQILEKSFATNEGNTNDEGSREGYEYCARIRGYGNVDFVCF